MGCNAKQKGHSAEARSCLGCLSKLESNKKNWKEKNLVDPSHWHMKNYGKHPKERCLWDAGVNGCLIKPGVNALKKG